MNIKILKLGPLETNCYILKKNNKVLVIDPASDIDKIIDEIGNDTLIGIIITHYHFDHIGALNELKDKYNVKVYDYNNLEEKEYDIGEFKFQCIYTLGHTMDSITIYFKEDNIMFTGDFLFKDSIGRTDLGGSFKSMKESINKIKEYNNITIYPGHGDITNLDYEKKNNYYFN